MKALLSGVPRDRVDVAGPPSWRDLLWEQAAHYEFYARRYGFTPDEVDGARRTAIELFPVIDQIRAEIRAEARRRANG